MKYKCSKCTLVQEPDFGDLLTTQCQQCGSIISQFTDIFDDAVMDPAPINSAKPRNIDYLLMKKLAIGGGIVITFLLATYLIFEHFDAQVGTAKGVVVQPTSEAPAQATEDPSLQLLAGINLSPPKVSVGKDALEITEVMSTDIPKTPYPVIKVSFCSEAVCTSENSLKEVNFDNYPRHTADYLSQDIITLMVNKSEVPPNSKGIGINVFYNKKDEKQ